MADDGNNSQRGRGIQENPANRFVKIETVAFDDAEPGMPVRTVLYRDAARSAITHNSSPDIGFEHSVNPYRGCEHGCAYCYARPTHEYLGLSAGLDFETKIFVKEEAPELLKAELASPSWEPRLVVFSGVTDCYQPIERKLTLTRRCLEVFRDCGNPIFLITKNALVTRDIDVLKPLAAENKVAVMLSITTLESELCGVLEPRTSRPAKRLEAIRKLSEAGIPVGVNVAPVIPGLTEHELPKILKAAAEAGATFSGYTLLRLPYVVKDLFADWLETHFPDRRAKVLNRVRELRGGRLNDSNFGSRMHGQGIWAQGIRQLYRSGRERARLGERGPQLSTENFRRPVLPKISDPRQLTLC